MHSIFHPSLAAKSVKIPKNIFNGSSKPKGHSTLLVEKEKEPIKSLMNTFRPGGIKGIVTGNKFRTTKNSPERLKGNQCNYEGQDIYQKDDANNAAPQQNGAKFKEIAEEANDIESIMRRKILKKKEKIKTNILNYSNPYGSKYSQKLKLESSAPHQNPSYLSHLKKDLDVSKQESNKKSDRVIQALSNHKRSISSVEGENELLCMIKAKEKKKVIITPRVDSIFSKLSEGMDSKMPSKKQTSKVDQKKTTGLKNCNDLSSIVSNVSSTIISQNQSLNNTIKNANANANANASNLINFGIHIATTREGKHSKTSANTQNNSRKNSIEKNIIIKNSKNLFLNKANKNSFKATSIASTNNSSSTLLSNQNQNKHNFGDKESHVKNMSNNFPIASCILATDQSHSGKVAGYKINSKCFHAKGLSEIPCGKIREESVYNNVKFYQYMTSNMKWTKKIGINVTSNSMSKRKDEKETEKEKELQMIPVRRVEKNSKSVSRIEDTTENYSNSTHEANVRLAGKPNCLTKKHIPVTASHSPTNLLIKYLAQNFVKKNSSGLDNQHRSEKSNFSISDNLMKGKPKFSLKIQGISKKESSFKDNTEFSTRQMPCNAKMKMHINLLHDENLESLLENSSDSLKSTMRESNYYRREMEVISNYIRQYSYLHGEYPKTNLKFYKYGRLLGRGAFGKVNIALHVATGRLVAIKSFNKSKLKSENAKGKIQHETQILKKLKHQFIVPIYETFETKKYIIIVMEYVCGGDLLSFVRKRSKVNESTARFIFRQIIEGLQYIHSKETVHRDIKLDNILIDLQNNVKICDFGVSKHIRKGDVMHDQCGTPAYIAPEILKNQGYEGFAVDIWSSGVVLYAMLSGTVPFKANNMNDLHRLIIKGTYPPIDEISEEASDLIMNLLEIDHKRRFTIEQILNHSWMKGGGDYKAKQKMNLFTAAEKILLAKANIDYRNANKDDLIENFTIRNLDTLQETENQNINTKSIILAPFNSSIKNNDSFLNHDLLLETDVLKFCGKPKELNRNYELNNNGEIDNGIIISPQEGNTPSDNNNNNNNNGTTPYIPVGFNNSINNKVLSQPISPAGEYDEKEGTMIIKNGNSLHLQDSAMKVDEKIIREVEEIGYKKDYVIKCLRNNEINYATTAYYLLLNHESDF